MRVYLDPEIDSYCCRTIAELLQLLQKKKMDALWAVCMQATPSWHFSGARQGLDRACVGYGRSLAGAGGGGGLGLSNRMPLYKVNFPPLSVPLGGVLSIWNFWVLRGRGVLFGWDCQGPVLLAVYCSHYGRYCGAKMCQNHFSSWATCGPITMGLTSLLGITQV